jgi:hypothetical protein
MIDGGRARATTAVAVAEMPGGDARRIASVND